MTPITGYHVSDLHDRQLSIARLCALKERKPSAKLLLTGDVTHNAWPHEFIRMANAIRHVIMFETMACPGNHDCFTGQTGVNWLPWWRKGIRTFDDVFDTQFYGLNDPAVHEFPDQGGVLILLDSNCESLWLSAAHGRVGWNQRMVLDRLLDEYKDWAVLVALHHHPFERKPFHYMLDAKKLMAVLDGRCSGLFFGHNHRFEHCEDRQSEYGIPHIWAAGALFDEPRVVQWRIDQGRLTTDVITL